MHIIVKLIRIHKLGIKKSTIMHFSLKCFDLNFRFRIKFDLEWTVLLWNEDKQIKDAN